MKKIILNIMLAAMALLAACTNNTLDELKPAENGTLTISLTAAPKTRIAATPKPGTEKGATIRWQEGDKIHLFFKQGTTIVDGGEETITNIAGDGLTAELTVAPQVGINPNQNYTIYGIHGVDCKMNGTTALMNISPKKFQPFDKLSVPVRFEANVTGSSVKVNATCEHIGALIVLTLQNATADQLEISDIALTPTGNLGYLGGNSYCNITKAASALSEDEPGTAYSSVTNILPVKFTKQLVAWVAADPNNAPGNIKLELTKSDNSKITSTNQKDARSEKLVAGKAYHLYAKWDGSNLNFLNTSIAPGGMPLALVAEYNLNVAGDGFLSSHKNSDNKNARFSWENAKTKAAAMSGWHLPTLAEWYSIFGKILDNMPGKNNHETANIRFDGAENKKTATETIQIGNVTQDYEADYKGSGNDIVYAIKMKGNGDNYRTAYRYYLDRNKINNDDYNLLVWCKYLGAAGSSKTIDDIADESFWSATDPDIVKRVFSAAGPGAGGVNVEGFYWSATENENPSKTSEAYNLRFWEHTAYCSRSNGKEAHFSVRLFAD